MVMFTYLTCQFTISAGERGAYLSDWMIAVCLSPGVSAETGNERPRPAARLGQPDCLLLSEADLIVRVGDGGVQAHGSVGQPYFLTLASWARGDGGQRVKLNLIPRFPLPAVMYIHRSSRCLALLEIHKKVNC